jgi:hypothetical protein
MIPLLPISRTGKLRIWVLTFTYHTTYTWRNRIGYPAQPGLIRLSVHLFVCLSVHACRLGVQQKMVQAQQIWSIILQNNEFT